MLKSTWSARKKLLKRYEMGKVLTFMMLFIFVFSIFFTNVMGGPKVVASDFSEGNIANSENYYGHDIEYAEDNVLVKMNRNHAQYFTRNRSRERASFSPAPEATATRRFNRLGIRVTGIRVLNPIFECTPHARNMTAEERADAFNDNLFEITFCTERHTVAEVIAILNASRSVVFAERNYIISQGKETIDIVDTVQSAIQQLNSVMPNDPHISRGLMQINAPAAWEITTGSRDVVVGVIDTGIDIEHPDLIDNLWDNYMFGGGHGWCFVTNSTDISDVGVGVDGPLHGTPVSGIIGAVGNNGIGTVGVNWNVSIATFRAGTFRGLHTNAVIAAINFAGMVGIPILNLSAGSRMVQQTGYSPLSMAIQNYDGLFVTGTGNDAVDNDFLPRSPVSYDLPNVIGVASLDSAFANFQMSHYSNFGRESVHIAAPSNVLAMSADGTFGFVRGTSISTPMVSGVAALVLAARPYLTPLQVRQAILDGAREMDHLRNYIFAGRVLDARGALDAALALDVDAFEPPARFFGEGINRSTIRLFWCTVPYATSFDIYYGIGDDLTHLKSLPAGMDAFSTIVRGLLGDTTYTFAIRAKNDYFGRYSTLKTIEVATLDYNPVFTTFVSGLSHRGEGMELTFRVLTGGNNPTVQIGCGNRPASSSDFYGRFIVPKTVTYDGITYTVTSIGRRAFYREGHFIVTGFNREQRLTELVLHEKIYRIQGRAFHHAVFDYIHWSTGLRIIEEAAFTRTLLRRIEIPESVEYIGIGAFSGTARVQEIILPASAPIIRGAAFQNTGELERVVSLSYTPPEGGILGMFEILQGGGGPSQPRDIPLFVPAGAEEIYRQTHWVYNFKYILPITDPMPPLTPEPTPTPELTINFLTSSLEGLVLFYQWNGQRPAIRVEYNNIEEVARITTREISPEWFGSVLSIRYIHNHRRGLAQWLYIPARPVMSGIGVINPSSLADQTGSITGLAADMEFRRLEDSEWQAVTGDRLDGLAVGTYLVRIRATDSSFASEATVVEIELFGGVRESTPEVSIDFLNERLFGFEVGREYLINGVSVAVASGGYVYVQPSWFGNDISVVRVGDGVGTTNSLAQVLAVLQRSYEPDVAVYQHSTTPLNNDGVIGGLSAAMEFRAVYDETWTPITSNQITGLLAGSYFIRLRSTTTAFASQEAELTIFLYEARMPRPDIGIDFYNERLTGFMLYGNYMIGGMEVFVDTDSFYHIIFEQWFGTTLIIIRLGDGYGSIESMPQELVILSRPSTPTAIGVNPTNLLNEDGRIINVDNTMEFRAYVDEHWQAITGDEITGLLPGTYIVRVRALDNAFASEEAVVVIDAFGVVRETTPNISINFIYERLTGFTLDANYTINGNAVAHTDTFIDILPQWFNMPLSIVRLGCGLVLIDSLPQVLPIPARPATPAVSWYNPTTFANDNGRIVVAGYAGIVELRREAESESEWQLITDTEVVGLSPDRYFVRVRATDTSFVGHVRTITIVSFAGTHEPTPNVSINFANETITGFSVGQIYLIDSVEVEITNANNIMAITSYMLGATISIARPGNGVTTHDSIPQELAIPIRAPAPALAEGVAPTTLANNDGRIIGVTNAMEFRRYDDTVWERIVWRPGIGAEVTDLAPGVYFVRVRVAMLSFAGHEAKVIVDTFYETQESTPNIQIDFINARLTGFLAGRKYIINGNEIVISNAIQSSLQVNAIQNTLFNSTYAGAFTGEIGYVSIAANWFGISLNITRVGDGLYTTDSNPQQLPIPTRAAAPQGLFSVNSVGALNNGRILGVFESMEYKRADCSEGIWLAVTGYEITGLAHGVYLVRASATATAFASYASQVEVGHTTTQQPPNICPQNPWATTCNCAPETRTVFTTRFESNFWNWFMFIILFGWIWMWF